MDTKKVLMLPFLAHGHISPFLELAKRLSQRNFRVYLCSSPINLASIKNIIFSTEIELVELDLPSLPDLPPHLHTTNGLPLHLNHLLSKVLKLGKSSLSDILIKIQPDLLIHDILTVWAGPMAKRLNIPAVFFFTSGPTVFAYFINLFKNPGMDFPFPEIRLSNFEIAMAMKNFGPENREEREPDDELAENKDTVVLVNTSGAMEGKYLDYLIELMKWTAIPVGVMIQEPNVGGGDEHDGLMKWLGEKDKFSTVFASFGSEYFLNKEEIEEIACGLEMSNVNFVWVIRFMKGDNTRVEEVLPEGFLERVGERGRVLDKWAPQARILTHSSVGGFVSHCGWNSILESIDFGVPMIAMPMHLDQPLNAKVVVQLGVGVEVKRDVEGKYRREEISHAIKGVVFEECGEDLRSKIGEQRESIRSKSREEFDSAVQKLLDICGKSQDA